MMSCFWNLSLSSAFLCCFPSLHSLHWRKLLYCWGCGGDMVAESCRLVSAQERDILSPSSNILIPLEKKNLLVLDWVTCLMSPLTGCKEIPWLAQLWPTAVSWGGAAPYCKDILLPDKGKENRGDKIDKHPLWWQSQIQTLASLTSKPLPFPWSHTDSKLGVQQGWEGKQIASGL